VHFPASQRVGSLHGLGRPAPPLPLRRILLPLTLRRQGRFAAPADRRGKSDPPAGVFTIPPSSGAFRRTANNQLGIRLIPSSVAKAAAAAIGDACGPDLHSVACHGAQSSPWRTRPAQRAMKRQTSAALGSGLVEQQPEESRTLAVRQMAYPQSPAIEADIADHVSAIEVIVGLLHR
jgi:hypothetical protein